MTKDVEVNDVTGMPQTVIVIGGSSDIALATLRVLASRRLERVVLLGRNEETLTVAAETLRGAGVAEVSTAICDVTEIAPATATVEKVMTELGSVDLVIVAAGSLGDSNLEVIDAENVAQTIAANFSGPAALMATISRTLSRQGSGRMIVLSSVAGVRVRKANFVYGSAKAGLDGFALGLDDALVGSGASIMIVRPGFVHSKMTLGMKAAPMSLTPEAVADEIVKGLERGAQIVWAPPKLKWLFAVLVHLPRGLWRRMPR